MRNATPTRPGAPWLTFGLALLLGCAPQTPTTVWVTDAAEGALHRVDLTSGATSTVWMEGSPTALAPFLDHLALTDAANHRVLRVDHQTGAVQGVFHEPTAALHLEEPADLVPMRGGLAVLGNDSRNVVLFDERETEALPSPPLRNAHALVCHGDELWVGTEPALRDLGLVLRLDAATGEQLGSFAPLGEIDSAMDLQLGPDGLLYVSDWYGNRVVRYDPDDFSRVDELDLVLERPVGTAFTPDGDLLVLEATRLSLVRQGELEVLLDGLTAARDVLATP